MTQTKEQTRHYQLKGNPILTDIPVIGNLVYDEVGKEVLALHNERFLGVKTIEDITRYKDEEPISYSNTPRVLSYNQILRESFPDLHILTPQEVVMYWDLISQRGQTYADTDSVVVYTKSGPGPNEQLRTQVLGILGKKETKVPLLVSGLGVRKATNNYGFEFTQTPLTSSKEAPYLEQNTNLAYDPKSGLVSSKEGIRVWTANSGLRRVYRDGSDVLGADYGDLLSSYENGRVQILQDPKGRAENLEDKLILLQEQRDTQIEHIEKRYVQALEYLKTGKIQQ